jgi:hypothetical protein
MIIKIYLLTILFKNLKYQDFYIQIIKNNIIIFTIILKLYIINYLQ